MTLLGCDGQPPVVDVCLVLERSGLIRDGNPPDGSYDNWRLMLEFSANIARETINANSRNRVGVVAYAGDPRLEIALNTYTNADDLENAILGISYDGGDAYIGGGMRITKYNCFAPLNGDRPADENIAFLISPGVPTPAVLRNDALMAAEELKDSGVTLVTIGIGDAIDSSFLEQLASPPQGEIEQTSFVSPDFQVLGTLQKLLSGDCDSSKSYSLHHHSNNFSRSSFRFLCLQQFNLYTSKIRRTT